jgi:hypothetical protein
MKSESEVREGQSQDLKHCKDCKGWLPADDFYTHPCTTDGRAAYCKLCHRKRATKSVKRLRKERAIVGVSQNAYRVPKDHHDGYLARHEQRREREREIEASFLRDEGEQPNAGEMSFADIKHNPLDPEPVFRDLTNRFLRPQTKVSSWKTA